MKWKEKARERRFPRVMDRQPAIGWCEANSHLKKTLKELFLLGGKGVGGASLEEWESSTAVQMFSQGHGSSLLASTRRSLVCSGPCL